MDLLRSAHNYFLMDLIGDTMNNSDLIDLVAEKANISKTAAGAAINTLFDTIMGELKEGRPFARVGFGTFTVRARAAREGRNPQTGAPIQIKARKVAAFKPGKLFNDAVQHAK